MKIIAVYLPLLLSISLHSLAADVTREVTQPNNKNSAFLEMGLSFISVSLPLAGFIEKSVDESQNTFYTIELSFEGRAQYKKFYAEALQDSFSNLTLGYSVYDTNHSSLDIIATNLFYTLEYEYIAGLESIRNRKGDLDLGFRSTHYFKNSLMQLELVGDITNAHNGFIGAINFGQQKQLYNWNLYALAGARYFTKNVVQHLFGVTAAEATQSIPVYQASDGYMPIVQFGATLPLSEKLTFNARVEYAKFPSSISNSPLAQGSEMHIGRVGFNYVFFN